VAASAESVNQVVNMRPGHAGIVPPERRTTGEVRAEIRRIHGPEVGVFLVPFQTWSFRCADPPDRALDRLRASVDDRWMPFGSMLPLRGSVGDRRFSVRKAIRYRNSFLPHLWGRVEAEGRGSRVTVVMSLHPLVGLFMVLWLSGVASAAIAMAAQGTEAAFVPLLMLVVGLVLPIGGFAWEADASRELLEGALGHRA
jgi:hypothetical protein